MRVQVNTSVLELVEGDITHQDTDAIVNAANPTLLGGGGVDGAIHRAGGPAILEECREIGGCPTGEARITNAGRLKAKKVIHTVGPVYFRDRDVAPALLSSAYRNSLCLASEHGLHTIAFPSVGTGAYGYPLEAAAPVALKTVVEYLRNHPDIILVRFVLYTRRAFEVYRHALDRVMAEM